MRRYALTLLAGLATGASAAQAPADATALSLEQLLEVSIVGASKYAQKQDEVAAAATVVTRNEIQAFGWRTLAEALASLPGIHLSYDRQYHYLGTRGFGLPGDFNTRVLLTINGNRVNDPVFDQGPPGRDFPLDLDLVERIEFIPGPGGAVYGQNAMFGVVNVVTRSGAALQGTEFAFAAQRPQGLREGRASWGGVLEGGLDVLLSASGLHSSGEDRRYNYGDAGVAGVARGLDGERDQELYARLARGAWSFDLVHGDRRKDDPTGAYFSDPLQPGQYQADRYTLAQLQFDRPLDPALQLSARVFAGEQRYGSILRYGTRFAFPAAGSWRGAELRLLSTAWADHRLLVGVELQDRLRRSQAVLDRADPSNDVHIRSTGYRYALFVQDEWRLGPTLGATLGLRLDRNDTTGTALSPRAGLIWQASRATTLKALYGRAHRAPNAYERDYDDGLAQIANPALQGERIDTVELVADRRVGRDLSLRGSLYHWTMQGLITLGIEPVSGLSQYRSGPEVRARGAELSADKTWDAGARLRGSVSWQSVEQSGGMALANSPRWLGKLLLSMPLPAAGWRVGYELHGESERRSLQGAALGGHVLSHLALSSDALAPGLSVALVVRNLFDKRHAHPGADSNWQDAIEQDGRSPRLALGLRY